MRINENAKRNLIRPHSTFGRTMASADLRHHLAEPPELGRALPHANDLGRAEPRAAVHAGGSVTRVVQDVLRPNRYDQYIKILMKSAIQSFGLKLADPKYLAIPVVNNLYET
jgi:hypothetical protein